MKLLKQLPRWLRFIGLTAFAALCVGISAFLLVEIGRSHQTQSSTAPTQSQTIAIRITPIESTPTASSTSEPNRSQSISTQRSTLTTTNQAPKTSSNPTSATSNPTASTPFTNQSLSQNPNASFTKPTEPFITTTAQPNTTQTPPQKTPFEGVAQRAGVPPTNAQPKYGHRPYAARDTAELVQVASYPEGNRQRAEKLHPEAATALLNMVAAARADGVWLVPASGYRTFAQQRTLFNAQVAKRGTPEAAAKISAPPGYSEHHTGYAIDLTDGNSPQNQDITPAFAATPAYQWLVNNAATHGFELSFPKNNPQGISFEPWHWRYIGSPQAQNTFKKQQTPTTINGGTDRILE